MHTYKDNAGRVWSVTINVAAMKRVKACLDGLNLYALINDADGMTGLGRLLGDPVALVDVLYVLCRDEAEARGVTDEAFGAALGGDSLQFATDAFVAEYVDFFPDPRQRAAIRAVLQKAAVLVDLRREAGLEELEAFDPVRAASNSNGRSGSSPAPSGSTPDRLPLGSSTSWPKVGGAPSGRKRRTSSA